MKFSKEKKTPQQIQHEYSQVCAQLGQLYVTQEVLPSQIEELHKKAKELDKAYKQALQDLPARPVEPKKQEQPQANA